MSDNAQGGENWTDKRMLVEKLAQPRICIDRILKTGLGVMISDKVELCIKGIEMISYSFGKLCVMNVTLSSHAL